MDPFKSSSTSGRQSSQGQQANPFARALAEAEKQSALNKAAGRGGLGGLNQDKALDQFNEQSWATQLNPNTLSNLAPGTNRPNNLPLSPDQLKLQQEEQAKEAKRKQMRDKLHRMVNPVEQTDIYNAREERRKKEINEVRMELKKLAEEIAQFYKEVDIAVTQDVVSPGQTGVYHDNFFTKLKEFIQMLRQRISSARTWARQARLKKKKRKYRYGLDFANQEAKSTHDMLHHERSNAFGA